MDAPTAIAIVAAIAAIAVAAAAFLTARSRIGVLAANAVKAATPAASSLPESARHARVFGWILVLLLYLAAVFCLLQGLNTMIVVHHFAKWQAAFGSALSAPGELTLYSRFWIAIAVALVLVAAWTQRRLRRRVG